MITLTALFPSSLALLRPVTPLALNSLSAPPLFIRFKFSTFFSSPVVNPLKFVFIVTLKVSFPAPPSILSSGLRVFSENTELATAFTISVLAVPLTVSATVVSVWESAFASSSTLTFCSSKFVEFVVLIISWNGV